MKAVETAPGLWPSTRQSRYTGLMVLNQPEKPTTSWSAMRSVDACIIIEPQAPCGDSPADEQCGSTTPIRDLARRFPGCPNCAQHVGTDAGQQVSEQSKQLCANKWHHRRDLWKTTLTGRRKPLPVPRQLLPYAGANLVADGGG